MGVRVEFPRHQILCRKPLFVRIELIFLRQKPALHFQMERTKAEWKPVMKEKKS